MQERLTTTELKAKVDDYINNLHFDTQACSTTEFVNKQDYLIKLITKFLVGLCSSYFTIIEVINYVRKRQLVQDIEKHSQ